MSELIQNRTRRREALKEIILQLHAGRSVEDVKAGFAGLLQTAGATEIAELESELIAAGLDEMEVKRLCDVHVAVFQDALEQQAHPETLPGHPLHTFRAENEAAGRLVGEVRVAAQAVAAGGDAAAVDRLRGRLRELSRIERHYSRKENLLFPFLEKRGIKGPSSVMWALHDDIRRGFKELIPAAGDPAILKSKLPALLEAITGLFYKEENILFPMALERLTEEEWRRIHAGSDEIGYAFVEPGTDWPAEGAAPAAPAEETPVAAPAAGADYLLRLNTGGITAEQLDLMLRALPVDVTFVDENDTVRYFSAGPDRIFVRTEAVIGRKVQNCHPPASVHIVQRILDDFRAGRRDVAEFWLTLGGRFVHIRYFPLRDAAGAYRGTVEVTQDVTQIRALQGERRLLDG